MHQQVAATRCVLSHEMQTSLVVTPELRLAGCFKLGRETVTTNPPQSAEQRFSDELQTEQQVLADPASLHSGSTDIGVSNGVDRQYWAIMGHIIFQCLHLHFLASYVPAAVRMYLGALLHVHVHGNSDLRAHILATCASTWQQWIAG